MITEPQRLTLDAIRELTDRFGYPPTMRELAERMGWASISTAQDMLDRLERKGLISRIAGQPRTLRVVEDE